MLSHNYDQNNCIGYETGKTGHLTKITDNLNTAKNKEYEFDALGRLTKAKGGNSLWTQTYSYDRFGNRTNVVASGVGIDNNPMQKDGIGNLTYDNLTNRITNSGVNYDVAGNQTRALAEDGVTWLKYEYDAANRLQVIKKDSDNSYLEAFQFGSTNQRLMKTDYALNQTTIYAGDVEYTEYVSTIMTWTKSYVRLGDSILSTITPNGSGGETTEFNHSDQLGTRLVTNQTTGTYTEQTTLPFGTGLASETSRAESKRFTSYDRSARTGLDYAINRTYDSKLGRFTQVDPIGMKAVNLELPQTLNLFGYCGNDPINHTDPDGLFFGAIGRFFQKVGRILNKIVSNIVFQVALTVLAAVLTAGMSLAASISAFTWGAIAVPAWLVVATNIVAGVSLAAGYAAKVGTVLELSGILLQGKFKQFGKIVGLAIVGALVAVVEDSVKNGFWEGLKTGNPISGAWNGFKQGLTYLKEIFSRKWQDILIPIYGFFCGPGWGIDGTSRREKPTDGQDSACRKHDIQNREAIKAKAGKWQRDWIDLRLIANSVTSATRGRFVDRFFGSGHKVGDVYSMFVPFAFGSRIVGRHLGSGR